MLIRSAIVVTLLLSASLAGAQSFSEKDRQTAGTWYTQHQAKPPAGFRQQDRLSPEAESKLQIGKRSAGSALGEDARLANSEPACWHVPSEQRQWSC